MTDSITPIQINIIQCYKQFKKYMSNNFSIDIYNYSSSSCNYKTIYTMRENIIKKNPNNYQITHSDIIKLSVNNSRNSIININFHICNQCYFSCKLFLYHLYENFIYSYLLNDNFSIFSNYITILGCTRLSSNNSLKELLIFDDQRLLLLIIRFSRHMLSRLQCNSLYYKFIKFIICVSDFYDYSSDEINKYFHYNSSVTYLVKLILKFHFRLLKYEIHSFSILHIDSISAKYISYYSSESLLSKFNINPISPIYNFIQTQYKITPRNPLVLSLSDYPKYYLFILKNFIIKSYDDVYLINSNFDHSIIHLYKTSHLLSLLFDINSNNNLIYDTQNNKLCNTLNVCPVNKSIPSQSNSNFNLISVQSSFISYNTLSTYNSNNAGSYTTLSTLSNDNLSSRSSVISCDSNNTFDSSSNTLSNIIQQSNSPKYQCQFMYNHLN